MVGWHHQLSGHEFEQALGVGEGQGSLKDCSNGVTKRHNLATKHTHTHTHTHNVAELTSLPENRDLLVHSAHCWRIHRCSRLHRPAGKLDPCPISLLRLLCPVSVPSPLLGPALLASPVTACLGWQEAPQCPALAQPHWPNLKQLLAWLSRVPGSVSGLCPREACAATFPPPPLQVQSTCSLALGSCGCDAS